MSIVNSNYINENKLENITNSNTSESIENLSSISNKLDLNNQQELNSVNFDQNNSVNATNQG